MKGDGEGGLWFNRRELFLIKTREGLIGNSIGEEEKRKVELCAEIVNNTRRVVCYFYLRLAIDNLTFALQCYTPNG